MTVSSRKTAAGIAWRYDFQFQGQRFTSPRTYGSKREAAREEKARRKAAERGESICAPPNSSAKPGATPKRSARSMRAGAPTLETACARYWEDVAKRHRSAADIHRRLEICKRLIGAGTLIADIRFATVSDAIQARRDEPSRYGKPLSSAAINRDIVDTLRPALNHAGEVFELALPRITWGKLKLKENAAAVREEFSLAEIEAWAGELGPTERLYLATMLTYGPRRGELYFPADGAIRLDAAGGPELDLGRQLSRDGTWRDSRKDGSLHSVTLMAFDAAALAAQAQRARAVGAAHIWIDEEGRAISYYAMGHRLRAAAARAGVEPGRIIHGCRHHAATAILRRGGSLSLAQRLLGHKKITTTQRYAHVANADLRAGLERVQAANSAPAIHAESPARVTPAA